MKHAKKYILLSIILYIVILCVALVSTLAWFIYDKSATISTEDDSRIVAGEYLEICIDDNDDTTEDLWTTDLRADNIAQFPDVSVTPNGTVWYPTTLDDSDNLIYGEEGRGAYLDVTNTDGYFIKLNLKVRASKAVNVYLHRDSFVSGVDLDKTDAADKYSKDYIAGASRVAFFEGNTAKMMWVPNEKYQLTIDDATGQANDFTYNGTAESPYKYLNVVDGIVTEGSEYLDWDGNSVQILEGQNSLATDTDNNGNNTPILSFTEAGEKKITLYIWVEGSDRESKTAFSGGSIKYNIKLVGITQKADAKINIDDVSYSAGALSYASTGKEVGAEILYSYNQLEWTPYATGNPNLAGEHDVLYVRARETATENAGPIKEISLK